jgi:hypothetical protein
VAADQGILILKIASDMRLYQHVQLLHLLTGEGTTEGAIKGWDTRGCGVLALPLNLSGTYLRAKII